jgi:hypothetical protein
MRRQSSGAKSCTEAQDADEVRMVGERRGSAEAAAEASRGALTRANVGMSNREVGCEPPPPKA